MSLPSTLVDIEDDAFRHCNGILGYQVAQENPNFCAVDGILFTKDKTELIGYKNGSSLKEYVVPSYVKKIRGGAFLAANNLTSLIISEGVEEIGDNYGGLTPAFSCNKIEKIVLPKTLKRIGYVFDNIYMDDYSVYYNGSFEDWAEVFHYDPFYGILNGVDNFYLNGELLTDLVVSQNVSHIRQGSLAGYKRLNSVVFSERTADNPLTIGYGAFEGCIGLNEITIPKYVAVNYNAFFGCSNLSDINLPEYTSETVKYKGEDSSGDLNEHKKVGFSCESSSFLDTAYWNNPKNWDNGLLYIDQYLVAIADEAVIEKLEVKVGTKQILDQPFESDSNIKESLKEIVLPKSLEAIGENAFKNCINLREITIKNKNLYIDGAAFLNCPSLQTIYYVGTKEDWDNYVYIQRGWIRYMDGTEVSFTRDIENATKIFENGAVIPLPDTTKPTVVPTTTKPTTTKPTTTKPSVVPTTRPTVPTTTRPASTTKPFVEEENIKKPSTSTVNYGETLILHINASNIPADAKIEWSVDGKGVTLKPSADGKTCAVTSTASGDVTITAKYTDASGVEHVSEQEIKSDASLWQKIVSFFKNLFGMNRVIEQRIKFN